MLNSVQETQQSTFTPITMTGVFSFAARRESYELNCHRVYSLTFWMTGNELAAEELTAETFRSAFAETASPSAHEVDVALVQILRQNLELPIFTLNCGPSTQVRNVRQNTLRVELERAVIELPSTEKLIFLLHDVERYDHDRIARLLGITERESQLGLHQARLRLREILSN